MIRHHRALLALALVAAFAVAISAVYAQPAAPAGQAQPVTQAKFVDVVRGTADVQYLKPTIKVNKDIIVTTFQVKNMSPKAIARLTIEEFWWDKNNNPVSGDKKFLKKPLMAGEVGTIVLETPKNPSMNHNSYKFSHQNGDIKPKQVTKF